MSKKEELIQKIKESTSMDDDEKKEVLEELQYITEEEAQQVFNLVEGVKKYIDGINKINEVVGNMTVPTKNDPSDWNIN